MRSMSRFLLVSAAAFGIAVGMARAQDPPQPPDEQQPPVTAPEVVPTQVPVESTEAEAPAPIAVEEPQPVEPQPVEAAPVDTLDVQQPPADAAPPSEAVPAPPPVTAPQEPQAEPGLHVAALGAAAHVGQGPGAEAVHHGPHFPGDFVQGLVPGNRLERPVHLFQGLGEAVLGILVVEDVQPLAAGIPAAAGVLLVRQDLDHPVVFYDPARAIGGRACPRTVEIDRTTLGTIFYDIDEKQPGGSGVFFRTMPTARLGK